MVEILTLPRRLSLVEFAEHFKVKHPKAHRVFIRVVQGTDGTWDLAVEKKLNRTAATYRTGYKAKWRAERVQEELSLYLAFRHIGVERTLRWWQADHGVHFNM